MTNIENLIDRTISGEKLAKEELRELFEDRDATERVVNVIMEKLSRDKVTQRLNYLFDLEERMDNGGPAMLKSEMDEMEQLKEIAWDNGWDV